MYMPRPTTATSDPNEATHSAHCAPVRFAAQSQMSSSLISNVVLRPAASSGSTSAPDRWLPVALPAPPCSGFALEPDERFCSCTFEAAPENLFDACAARAAPLKLVRTCLSAVLRSFSSTNWLPDV